MQDEQLSGAESMQIIQNMINKAKNQFSENGFSYLLWGWAVFICALSQFVLLYYFEVSWHYVVWFLTWAVLVVQFLYVRKQRKMKRVETYTGEILKYVWICFVVVIFLISYILGSIFGREYYQYMNPLLLVSYGIPTFLSGIILRFRPLVIGGIACWVLAIAASATAFKYQTLLLVTAVAIAWIIPGYLLRARFKKENN